MFNINVFIHLGMNLFDFHHHHSSGKNGIYNLKCGDTVPEGLFSAGIHPNAIGENTADDFVWLKNIIRHDRCVAIGECGLDALISTDEKLQEEVFARQIDYANEIRKPIIVHCVRKFHRLSHFEKLSKVPMIVHGFNKRKTVGDDLLKNDFFLSFGKSVLYDVNLQNFFREVPLNKIFMETDSAEFHLPELYEKAAVLKNMTLENFVSEIYNNLHTLKIPI